MNPNLHSDSIVGEKYPEDTRYIRKLFQRALRKSIVSDLFSRLLIIAVSVGALVFTQILSSGQLTRVSTILFIVLSLSILASLYFLRRSRTLAGVSKSLAFYSFLLFSWWIFTLSSTVWSNLESLYILIVLISVLSVIPSLGFIQDFVFLLISVVAIVFSAITGHHLTTIILVVVSFLAFRNTLVLGVQALVSSATLAVDRLNEQIDIHLLRMILLDGLSTLFRIERFGVAEEGAPSLLCVKSGSDWNASPHTPISEVAPDILKLEEEGGIIHPKILGKQFMLRVREVFGLSHDALAFFSLSAPVVSGTAQNKGLRVFFPLNYLFSFVGRQYAFRLALLFVSSIERGFSLARVREQSSSEFSETSRIVEEQQADINQIIHLVNNVAQELSAVCIEAGEESSEKVFDEIGDSLQSLAADVSDYRLASEIQQLIDISTNEKIYLVSFQHSVERYVHALVKRDGIELRENSEAHDDNLVLEGNESLILFLIRTLTRLLMRRVRANDLVEFSSRVQGGEFIIELECDESIVHEDGNRRFKLNSVDSTVLEKLPLFQHFFPTLQIRGPNLKIGHITGFRMVFPVRESIEASVNHSGTRWVLFVDDNQQILQLYKRIAGALKLEFQVATGIGESESYIKERGMPSLVITDLELDDGNGVELIGKLKKGKLKSPPVLVISGEGEAELSDLLQGKEGVSYLSKPVSQQVLIKTIRELLDG